MDFFAILFMQCEMQSESHLHPVIKLEDAVLEA